MMLAESRLATAPICSDAVPEQKKEERKNDGQLPGPVLPMPEPCRRRKKSFIIPQSRRGKQGCDMQRSIHGYKSHGPKRSVEMVPATVNSRNPAANQRPRYSMKRLVCNRDSDPPSAFSSNLRRAE